MCLRHSRVRKGFDVTSVMRHWLRLAARRGAFALSRHHASSGRRSAVHDCRVLRACLGLGRAAGQIAGVGAGVVALAAVGTVAAVAAVEHVVAPPSVEYVVSAASAQNVVAGSAESERSRGELP